MAYEFESPSGLVHVHLPERFGARWAIWVRGEMLANGRVWRDYAPVWEAMEEIAAKCDETPGLGEAGRELRALAVRG